MITAIRALEYPIAISQVNGGGADWVNHYGIKTAYYTTIQVNLD